MKDNELHHPVASGDAEHLRALIHEQPEYIRKTDTDGMTPLQVAARDGHLEAVKVLVENAADLEVRDPIYCRTPLGWATFHGHAEVVEFLAGSGADVNAEDGYGNTPLKTANMGSEGAWSEWVPRAPHEYAGVAEILRGHGAQEKHTS